MGKRNNKNEQVTHTNAIITVGLQNIGYRCVKETRLLKDQKPSQAQANTRTQV
jgi:hypothetical protein